MAGEPSVCAMRVRLVLAVIGLFVGVSILFTFGFVYKNWDCAAWGLLSGVFAGVTLVVHIQQNRGAWQKSTRALKALMLLGCFVQLAGVCGFVAYLSIAINSHQSVSAYPPGYYVAAVWCFMTWKWGFMLFYFSRQYRRLYHRRRTRSKLSPSKDDYEPLPS